MKDFFKSVRRHIAKLDAAHLREQYGRIADEMSLLESVFQSMNEAVVVLDADGEIAYENAATKALLGMKAQDALPTLALPLGRASKRAVEITYPEPKSLEAVTMPTSQGGTIILIRDITSEKERTEEELRAGATRAVRDLAAGVAHEIGNPLNALSLNLQLIKRMPSDAVAIAEECEAQVKRLDGILKNFLQALRQSHPNLMPGNVADPLKDCLQAMKPQLVERKIAVTLDVPGTLPSAAIDKGQLEQVFFNLVKNAMEAIRDGGTIDIDLDADDNDIIVVFRDNGIGMSEEQVIHLFEPYKTNKEFGTGLGLMISARIVRDHGGTISVESKPNEGTAFTIKLPRLERRIRVLK